MTSVQCTVCRGIVSIQEGGWKDINWCSCQHKKPANKDILEKISDEAIEKEFPLPFLDIEDFGNEAKAFEAGKPFGARWMRDLLLPEIEKIMHENEKLNLQIKKMKPRRLIDED